MAGYSIASGNYFSANKDNISYAVSTPWGNKGIGQVFILLLQNCFTNVDTLSAKTEAF